MSNKVELIQPDPQLEGDVSQEPPLEGDVSQTFQTGTI